ncbi:S-layer homology domain-containing protein [Anaerotignum lactatifermentans]|uniref:S-layer homology domain-containing protein n=1 Tax=Anaerotignum lactatifermentans TaxID=160404 RepID=A0ABS2GCR4_9FIRM|nr:S-layer homology domain-containing protein [Anaerotignum lactatifermentans]
MVAYAEDGSEQTAAVVSTEGEISTLGTEDSAEGQEDAKIADVASVTVDGQATGYETLANAVVAANRAEGEVVLDLLEDTTVDISTAANNYGALDITKSMTINGNGHKITATGTSASSVHVLNIMAKNVAVNDLVIDGDGLTQHGVQSYNTTGTKIKNVTSKNNKGYGLVVNSSEVTVDGLTTENNGWGGVNVDKRTGTAVDAKLTFNEGTIAEKNAVYVENAASDISGAVITGGTFHGAVHKVENAELTVKGGTIVLSEDINYDTMLTALPLASGNAFTVDLDGHTITIDNGSKGRRLFVSGDLTLKSSKEGGKVVSDKNAVVDILAGGSFTVGKNVSIESTASAGILLKANTKLTVDGATIKGLYYGIVGNGTEDNTQITINSGYIEGVEAEGSPDDAVAIYHPQLGDLTINGGTIVSASGVQYCGAGRVTITGGKIIAQADYTEFPSKTAAEGDGTAIDGAALSLISRGGGYQDNDDKIHVTITGGTLTSKNNSAISVYRLEKSGDKWITNDSTELTSYLGSLRIANGVFKGSEAKGALEIDGVAKDAVTVTGGTFSSDPSAYVASGYRVKTDGTNFYVSKKSSSSSSSDSSTGGSSSGSTGTTTETTENKDGSTTTTVTKPDGTKTETTENKDGSTVTVVTKPDGTKTETTENKDGSKVEVTETKDGTVTTTETDKEGNKTETVETKDGAVTTTVEQVDGTTSKVTVDADGVTKTEVSVSEEAAKENEVVALPIPSVRAEKDASDATAVEIEVKGDEATKVEIPVKNMTAGTVAVVVDESGRETVVKTSLVGENGIVLTVEGNMTVKIVDNSKEFNDVADSYWGSDAVQFAASRELFAGTGEKAFTPDGTMTRAMVWTVLARLDGMATGSGANWYEAGRTWAVANGISDGTNLDGAVSREQLASMLYRYAQMKGYNTSVQADLSGYTDASNVSGYAVTAMQWANAAGVVNGTSNVTLDAGKDSTRAQVATMLMNFCKNVVK